MNRADIILYSAPPLAFDNVLEAVKRVRNWRELAEWLMGWYDYEGSDGEKKLDAIQCRYVSDEARLKAVVTDFLMGEQPSWRMLIHALHCADESYLTEKIKTNAEPHQGEWVSVM
jgi:hypothetical protein